MRSVRAISLGLTACAILTASGFAQEVVVPGPSFEDVLSLERVNSQRFGKPIWNEDVTVPVDVTEQERN